MAEQNQINQQQHGQGQSGSQVSREDVMMGQDVNVPYDQNPSGDPHHTVWDDMVNALKPDLTPNKNKGNGVLGTMDVNQKGGSSS